MTRRAQGVARSPAVVAVLAKLFVAAVGGQAACEGACRAGTSVPRAFEDAAGDSGALLQLRDAVQLERQGSGTDRGTCRDSEALDCQEALAKGLITCDSVGMLSLCPVECDRSCKPTPPPTPKPVLPNCTSYDAACLARRTACYFADQMIGSWQSEDANITRVQHQFLELCMTGELPENSTNSFAEVKSKDRSEDALQPALALATLGCNPSDCTSDVYSEFHKDEATAYLEKAGKRAAAGSMNMAKALLKDAALVGIRGVVAFGFLSAALTAYWPSKSDLPMNACSMVDGSDWAKCVWEQIQPFMAKYMAQQIDNTFEELWEAHLAGLNSDLLTINETAYLNSERFDNGTIKNMPPDVERTYYQGLNQVHHNMTQAMPLFMTNHAINTTGGVYLAQFAGQHISVMTTMFASLTYRTEGDRWTFASNTLCYANNVFRRAFEARSNRLAQISSVATGYKADCRMMTEEFECRGTEYTFRDTHDGCNKWNEHCPTMGCAKSCFPTRCGTSSPTCFEEHKKYVAQQLDRLWDNWLAAVPYWLHTVITMNKTAVNSTARPLPRAFLPCTLA